MATVQQMFVQLLEFQIDTRQLAGKVRHRNKVGKK